MSISLNKYDLGQWISTLIIFPHCVQIYLTQWLWCKYKLDGRNIMSLYILHLSYTKFFLCELRFNYYYYYYYVYM